MGQNTDATKPLRDMADKLDRWPTKTERKVKKDTHLLLHFSGKLKGTLENLPELVFMYLKDFRPDQHDPIKSDYDNLISLAEDVDEHRKHTGTDSTIKKMLAQTAAKKLAKKLGHIADTAKQYQEQTIIVRTIEKQKKVDRKKTAGKKVADKKIERRFKPWVNQGDACFIIVRTKVRDWTVGIHFYHSDKHKNLRLKSGSRTENLLTGLKGNCLIPEQIKTDIGNQKTKASDVVTYTNKLLNEKIRKMGFIGLPDYDVAFVLLKTGRYECTIPIYTKDEFDNKEIKQITR